MFGIIFIKIQSLNVGVVVLLSQSKKRVKFTSKNNHLKNTDFTLTKA